MLRSPYMPSDEIVALLVAERDRLNRALEALQGPVKRRGRPPKDPFAAASTSAPPVKKGRRTFTAEQRAAQAARMKAFWAKRKKAKK